MKGSSRTPRLVAEVQAIGIAGSKSVEITLIMLVLFSCTIMYARKQDKVQSPLQESRAQRDQRAQRREPQNGRGQILCADGAERAGGRAGGRAAA